MKPTTPPIHPASRLAVVAAAPARGGIALALSLAMLALPAAEPGWFPGITEPIQDVTMAFPVVGVVGTRPVAEGASVTNGQVVIELDKQLEQLDVERKRLARDLASSELERLNSLAQRNAISVSREELGKKKAEFDIARVDLELAAAVLRRRQILAPFDGQVALFHKDVGEKCEEQQPVVRVVNTRRCLLVANVEPRLATGVRLGQRVPVEVAAGDATVPREATVTYVSPVVDAASGLLRIKAEFDNADGKVRPGVPGHIQLK